MGHSLTGWDLSFRTRRRSAVIGSLAARGKTRLVDVDRAAAELGVSRRLDFSALHFGRGMPPWVMTGAGWSEAVAWGGPVPIGPILWSKATLRQQFDCHAFGNAFAGTWNLERFRPDRTTVWTNGVAFHHCNWETANLY